MQGYRGRGSRRGARSVYRKRLEALGVLVSVRPDRRRSGPNNDRGGEDAPGWSSGARDRRRRGVRAAGLGCTNANLLPRPQGSAAHPTQVTEQVTCAIGEEASATISIFANHASLTSGLRVIHDEVCARTPRPTNLTYATGNNWIIFPEEGATARRIASSLPATLGTLHC
jgi:hypothetical protein